MGMESFNSVPEEVNNNEVKQSNDSLDKKDNRLEKVKADIMRVRREIGDLKSNIDSMNRAIDLKGKLPSSHQWSMEKLIEERNKFDSEVTRLSTEHERLENLKQDLS